MVLMLALIMHLLADFYFQTDSMATGKLTKGKQLIKHLLVYGICMIIAVLPFLSQVPLWTAGAAWVLLAGSHTLIDCVKGKLLKMRCTTGSSAQQRTRAMWVFFLDQALHLICVALVLLLIPFDTSYFGYGAIDQVIGSALFCHIVTVVLLFLFLLKPSAITVRLVLGSVQNDAEDEDPGIEKAGTMIGILERLIIAVFALCGQPAAIAFVIAAKSLARFKQLENRAFAERYLVGTLTSTLLALVASLGAQYFLMQ
ncbi:MAG: DUF3307 domain-containing protein [Eggerthellaceae bacterium]|nr:DUF3307 domain-containing protein [Eggerthellaceae bacterium]